MQPRDETLTGLCAWPPDSLRHGGGQWRIKYKHPNWKKKAYRCVLACSYGVAVGAGAVGGGGRCPAVGGGCRGFRRRCRRAVRRRRCSGSRQRRAAMLVGLGWQTCVACCSQLLHHCHCCYCWRRRSGQQSLEHRVPRHHRRRNRRPRKAPAASSCDLDHRQTNRL